jgi:hypothetical protein
MAIYASHECELYGAVFMSLLAVPSRSCISLQAEIGCNSAYIAVYLRLIGWAHAAVGASTEVKDADGRTALDRATSEQAKQLLSAGKV